MHKLGAKHVIFVNRQESVRDDVAFEFTKEFYKLIMSRPNI
jgi:hypothetical protein